MTTRTLMRNALFPLLEETIARANWDDHIVRTPSWYFTIVDGCTRFSYSVGSAPNKPGEAHAYRPVIHDGGIGELLEESVLPGNLLVAAYYNSHTPFGEQPANADIYNPNEGISIEDWAARFISEAKRHVSGHDTNRR